jgi:hypothetical protein
MLGWAVDSVRDLVRLRPGGMVDSSHRFPFFYSHPSRRSVKFSVLARVIPEIIPPYVWMIGISALAGLGLLWIVSIWRFSHKPQGVTA